MSFSGTRCFFSISSESCTYLTCAQGREKVHFRFEKDLCLFFASCTATKGLIRTRLKGQYCFVVGPV